MRSKWHNAVFEHADWGYFPGSYPDGEPDHAYLFERLYSDDLIQSTNHGSDWEENSHMSKSYVTSDFEVKRRIYDEVNTLGEGSIHFSPSTDPHSPGAHFHGIVQARSRGFHNWDFPRASGHSEIDLSAMGTSALAKIMPTKPQADLGTFIAELREGIPSMIGFSRTGRSRTARAKNAGDEYLNVEFGWKPLVRDLRQFCKVIEKSSDFLDTYHKNSGVLLKRSYKFPTEFEVKVVNQGLNYPSPMMAHTLYGPSPRGDLYFTQTRKVEVWVEAHFKYFVPEYASQLARYRSDAKHLLGVDLTPEVVWNAAPWSWFADWFGNIGDIMSNLTYLSTDNLVMPGAWIMERVTESHTYSMRLRDAFRTYPGGQRLEQTFTSVSKKRRQATPYGFGLNWDGFTPKQLGILAALGISKSSG